MNTDRTQTLSVADCERLAAAAENFGRGIMDQGSSDFWRRVQTAALSQPEQGETPSLVLSDEGRARLEKIAERLEARSEAEASPWRSDDEYDAAFLRNLASQEYRGEEDKGRFRAWLADEIAAMERIDLTEVGEAQLRTLRKVAREVERLEPSTGEAARLRERLLDACEERSHVSDDGNDYVYIEGIETALDEVLPAPSDSQGGQDWPEQARMLRCAAESIAGEFPGFASSLLGLAHKLAALPAAVPSEPSVLEEKLKVAEGQRETHRRNNERLLAEDRALREEVIAHRTALEELAAEFEKSAELDFLEGPMCAPKGERGNFEGAAEAFKEAAAKVREKAAALKGGEADG